MEKILEEMLTYRGFTYIDNSLDDYWTASNDTNFIIIFFSKNTKICIKKIKEFIQIFENFNKTRNIDYIILIYSQNITSFARTSLANDIPCPYQLFCENELLFNITKHMLVPRHEILSKEEKCRFLNKNKFKIQNLPRIYESDPVIKFLYGKKGDIVRIIRASETSGTTLYYRVIY